MSLSLSPSRNLGCKPQDPSRSKLQGRRRHPCVRFLYHTSYCTRPVLVSPAGPQLAIEGTESACTSRPPLGVLPSQARPGTS